MVRRIGWQVGVMVREYAQFARVKKNAEFGSKIEVTGGFMDKKASYG